METYQIFGMKCFIFTQNTYTSKVSFLNTRSEIHLSNLTLEFIPGLSI